MRGWTIGFLVETQKPPGGKEIFWAAPRWFVTFPAALLSVIYFPSTPCKRGVRHPAGADQSMLDPYRTFDAGSPAMTLALIKIC